MVTAKRQCTGSDMCKIEHLLSISNGGGVSMKVFRVASKTVVQQEGVFVQCGHST